MAITASDLKFMLSTMSGTQGSSIVSTPSASLGKYVSTSEVAAGANGMFDDVTGSENAASESEYRCVFVLNDHGTLDYQNAVAYISSQVAGGCDVAITTDNIVPTPKGTVSAQATFIADEDTEPVGIGSWANPPTAITGISLGTIPAQHVKALWVRRTATDSVAVEDDGFTLNISGDSSA